MYQQLWGYKVEEKLYLGVREQKMLNTTGLVRHTPGINSPKYTLAAFQLESKRVVSYIAFVWN
jgi:hypothetical protein